MIARLFLLTIAISLSIIYPSNAFAHTPFSNQGIFIASLLHPYFVIPHLLLTLSLGLLIGQQATKTIKYLLISLMLGLIVGLVVFHFLTIGYQSLIILLTLVVIGILLILDLSISSKAMMLLSLWTGVALGMDSLHNTQFIYNNLLSITGIIISFCLSAIYIVGITEKLHQPWMKIGIRIVASWITTIALMVLSLIYYKGEIPTQHNFQINFSTQQNIDTINSQQNNHLIHRYRANQSSSKTNYKIK